MGAYTLSLGNPLSRHNDHSVGMFHDGVYDSDLELNAMAASGDAFETLATRLDEVSRRLPADSTEYTQIERVILALLYFQRNHTISRKR